jgi:hypothetical protein
MLNNPGNFSPTISRVKIPVVSYHRKLPWYFKFDAKSGLFLANVIKQYCGNLLPFHGNYQGDIAL